MKNAYWIGIAVAALIVGVLLGYSFWGSSAGKLPEVEKELSSVQARVGKVNKSKMAEAINPLRKFSWEITEPGQEPVTVSSDTQRMTREQAFAAYALIKGFDKNETCLRLTLDSQIPTAPSFR